MKKTCKKIMIAVMVLASIFAMVSCGSSKESAGSENDKELNQTKHLNIAKQMVLGYIPLYIMEEKGWLEEALASEGYENVEVTYTEFESGPPENEAFAAGQQDIGVMGNVPAISGIAAGQERDIIGVAYNGEKTLGIIVPNTSQIKDVSELKGKKVGVVVGSIGQDFMNAILNNSGISMDEIEVVNLGVAELENALITNQVDAISAWNPTLIKICSAKNGKLLADGTGIYAGENVIIANRQYTLENPDIVRIFMTQYARGVRELKDNFDQYAKEYAEVTGLSEDILKETWSTTNFQLIINDNDEKELEKTADFLYEYGLISSKVDVSSYVNFSFSENQEILNELKD